MIQEMEREKMTRQEIENQISQCETELKKHYINLSAIDKELDNVEIDIDAFQKMFNQFMQLVYDERERAASVDQSLGIRFALSYNDSMRPYLYGSKYAEARAEMEKGMKQIQAYQEELENERKLIKRVINEYENQLAYLRRQRMYVTS